MPIQVREWSEYANNKARNKAILYLAMAPFV